MVDQPIANFQIGLASAWITPDNSDNKDKPLAPEGTLARKWPERGPTWDSVFQTVEGGLGYWAGNHFRYGPPKFSMNATPQCYDYEIGSPGWSFFYSNQALPDHRLGIAQLSNRLLIPPDALPFQGNPNGEFLGYTWMALPFTDPTGIDPPTGDQSWTCFLSTANFKGPIAYYIPETWSKIGKIFTIPSFMDAVSMPGQGSWAAAPWRSTRCHDSTARTVEARPTPRSPGCDSRSTKKAGLTSVQDVTYYSRAALYDRFKAWRKGGPPSTGRFDKRGAGDAAPGIVGRRAEVDLDGIVVGHDIRPASLDCAAREHREQLVIIGRWPRPRLVAEIGGDHATHGRIIGPGAMQVFQKRNVDLIEHLFAGPVQLDHEVGDERAPVDAIEALAAGISPAAAAPSAAAASSPPRRACRRPARSPPAARRRVRRW